MSIDWKHLRSFSDSQNTAFEELRSQLVACEPMPEGSKFIRKGVPDAGIECFWQLPDGSEMAW